MQSSTNSPEKPAIQGTHLCRGKFLFLANEESRNPFVAAGAPKGVGIIGAGILSQLDVLSPVSKLPSFWKGCTAYDTA